jgi:hypothetical protein
LFLSNSQSYAIVALFVAMGNTLSSLRLFPEKICPVLRDMMLEATIIKAFL